VGMGQQLYESSPVARAVFDQADHQLGFPLTELCFEGPEDRLTDTVNQQPALFTVSVAVWKEMKARNWDVPEYVAGHSLGEFSALAAAGSLSFSDGLALVRRRGELMKAAGESEPGAMAAVLGLDVSTVESLCARASENSGQPLQVANDNCPGQVVISGSETSLVEAMRLTEEAGARKVVRLPITIAAHSSLMASAANDFARAVDETLIERPKMPVIGNVSALPLMSPSEIRSELKAQLTSPVKWTESMNYLVDRGVDSVVEVGPGSVLLNLMKRLDRKINRLEFDFGG
jgi:[acyl-carrier-protein] S-malonyltransferase